MAPVDSPIVGRFIAPACPYCAGRRTIEFRSAPDGAVRAPISGDVSFAGLVAGTSFVTITVSGPESQPTWLVTIAGVRADTTLVTGMRVDAGSRLGSALTTAIRMSLRRVVPGAVAEYVDPEPSVLRWRGPVRLIPDPTGPDPPRRTSVRSWSCRRFL